MKKTLKILVPLALAALIIASIGWYLFVYDRSFTRDTLLSQARFHDLHGNSRISAMFYDMAYTFSDQDEDVAIELANQYKGDGNFTKAEYTLTNAINNGPTADLYTALCKTYLEQDKILDAVTLLDNIPVAEIKDLLNAQRPDAPSANYDAGYYSQYIDVALSSSGGTLYYTTDGEYPSISGSVYEAPITLPGGETIVHAVCVNENGLVSPLTVLGYTVSGVIEEVVFTDPAMESAIRSLIGADPDDTVYTNELWDITEFTVPEDAALYGDLTMMPYLQKLTIQNQSLDTLAYLTGLTDLQYLDLSGSDFPAEELSSLVALTALDTLAIAECGISTIEALQNLPSLTKLDASGNTIRNLEALSTMPTLEEINLESNAVKDLTPLGNLTNLQTLNVSHNSLTTLSPLSGCIRLTSLDAGNNQIDDLDGAEDLTMLTRLSVEHNALTDVSGLAACATLTYLDISNNEVDTIAALASLTALETFNFASNAVTDLPDWPTDCALLNINGTSNALTDLTELTGMSKLTHVFMDYNEISDVSCLENCYCLVQVNVYGNPVGEVSMLRDRDIIVNYDPT